MVSIRKDHISNEDFGWNLATFKRVKHEILNIWFNIVQDFKVVVSQLNKHDLEFDLIGIDASIANALRRVMISEVCPDDGDRESICSHNTSVMHDEILAHRLGLVPILADPRQFQFKDDIPTDLNTIVFKLNVKSAVRFGIQNLANEPVYSKDLKWIPEGDQEERFALTPIKPVHDDILLVKLRPGQQIIMDLHCQKGIGKEHAKWSPVATASYRLLPEIKILSPIIGSNAVKFQKCFPKGVQEARVVNPRKDTVSREVLRHPEFEGKVALSRIRDHFIFSIESSGILPPHTIFEEAAQVLINKCQILKKHLQVLEDNVY
ncbi:DNA-directed RNA polymerase [Chytridium lagenaria]|nr:DNA-directed RNA polymerase [Chytridium lagenaria]